jgi:hypothetical protein
MTDEATAETCVQVIDTTLVHTHVQLCSQLVAATLFVTSYRPRCTSCDGDHACRCSRFRPLCTLRPSVVSTPAATIAHGRRLSHRLLRVWIQPGGLSTRGPAWSEAAVLRGGRSRPTHMPAAARLFNPSTKPALQVGFVRDERLAFNMPGFSPLEPAFASIVPAKGDECHGAVSD